MELTATLINLQGVLIHLCKTNNSLVKIKYKGGNEMKISSVVKEIQTFLKREGCIIDDQLNKGKESTIQDIVLFLALNCEFKEEPEMKDYEHLMGINVKLSTCLFANVITDLCLTDAFATVLDKFPFNVQTEFLQEFLICLKKIDVSLNLSFITAIITSVVTQINKFSENDRKLKEQIEGLVEVSSEILDVFKGLDAEKAHSLGASRIYQEMGYKLLKLLQLLLLCDPSKECLTPLINNVICICCDITAAVTVNVFCEWAEVEENGEPLQAAVSSAAYYVINKYEGHQPAKQLIMMMSTMARKPKTVQELIESADSTKMIQMIEKSDENQKQWFQALLRTQVFSNEKSIRCLEKYYKLCDESEVERILSFCRAKEIDDRKLNLVLKCASVIPLSSLVLVITRYFHNYGIHTALNKKSNKDKLVLLLNKMEDNEHCKKEMLLLILQNLKEVLTDLYRECLKNSVYVNQLKSIFSEFKEIFVVGNASFICLEPLIIKETILENHIQLTALLKTLLETECIKYDIVVNQVIMLHLENFLKHDEISSVLYLMTIFNELYLPNNLKNPEILIKQVFKVLFKCRCGFYDYDSIKYNTARECVKFLSKCEECENLDIDGFQEGSIEDYYIKRISSNMQVSLFNFLFSKFDMNNNYHEFICDLVEVLPTYVAEEWKEVASAMQSKCGTENTVKALTDVLILLSTIAGKQTNVEMTAIQLCLNHYMISIKDLQQSNIEDHVIITKHVCRLLRQLNPKVKEHAEVIVGLITDASLKTLSKDSDFVSGIVAIGNKKICQMLAHRMLNLQ